MDAVKRSGCAPDPGAGQAPSMDQQKPLRRMPQPTMSRASAAGTGRHLQNKEESNCFQASREVNISIVSQRSLQMSTVTSTDGAGQGTIQLSSKPPGDITSELLASGSQ